MAALGALPQHGAACMVVAVVTYIHAKGQLTCLPTAPSARPLCCADPSRRPSVQDLMRHTWCQSSEGVSPEQLIRCNDALVAQTLASPPDPEVSRTGQGSYSSQPSRPICKLTAPGPAAPCCMA